MALSPAQLYVLIASFLPWTGQDPGTTDPDEARDRNPRTPDGGQLRTAGIVGVLLSVLALIIVVFLLSGVADPYFNATENITDAFEVPDNASLTGSDTIDNLMGPFQILVAGVLTIGFVKLITDRVQT